MWKGTLLITSILSAFLANNHKFQIYGKQQSESIRSVRYADTSKLIPFLFPTSMLKDFLQEHQRFVGKDF